MSLSVTKVVVKGACSCVGNLRKWMWTAFCSSLTSYYPLCIVKFDFLPPRRKWICHNLNLRYFTQHVSLLNFSDTNVHSHYFTVFSWGLFVDKLILSLDSSSWCFTALLWGSSYNRYSVVGALESTVRI